MPHLLARDPGGRFTETALDGEELTVGRAAGNRLQLSDPSVSRAHAAFAARDGQWRLRDLGSRLGTLLNGSPVAGETALADGDWLRLGDTLVLYRDGPPAGADRRRLEALAAHAADADAAEITRIAFPAAGATPPSPGSLTGWRHTVFAGATEALRSAAELEDVLTVLLGVAFDVMSPERGVVLVADPESGELAPAVAHPDGAAAAISWTVVRQAVEGRQTLMIADLAADDRFRDARSVLAHDIRAAVCCPLVARERVLGALYLDTRGGDLAARREEAGLLNLVACYAATAVENALLQRERRGDEGRVARDSEPLVAQSPAMKAVVKRLPGLGSSAAPLLITGEAGSGRLFIARRIHLAGRGRGAPFVVIDCATPRARDMRDILFAEDGGAWRMAAGGTLVLRDIAALDPLSQSDLCARLEAAEGAADGADALRSPRLIATADADLAVLAQERGFARPLAALLGRTALALPPLRERRDDILPLARVILASQIARTGDGAAMFAPAAERALQAAKYRQANAAELREAVELAAVLAGGHDIGSEHVFTGPRARNHRLEFDISGRGPARWLSRRRTANGLQAATAVVFGGLVGTCLLAGGGTAGRVANALVWGLWWPLLLLLFLLVGRAWCYLCPLSRVARLAQSAWTLGRKPAPWLKERTGWVSAALFLAIVWSEHVFDMPHRPAATGVFLLALAALAIGFALVTQREAWCRHACPLGNLSAGYSLAAPMHVHSNPLVCAGQCRTHECFKGSEREPGCPMSVHPLYLRDAHFCKLCLACLRSCPHGSARLWLRPPLQDIWSLGEVNPALAPLAFAVFLLAPVMLAGAVRPAVGDSPLLYTTLAVSAFAMAAPLGALIDRGIARDDDSGPGARVAFSLLVVAWGPLVAFHLGNVPGLDLLTLQAEAVSPWVRLLPDDGLPVLATLRVIAVAAAGLAGLWALGRSLPGAAESAVRRGAMALVLLYCAGSVLLCV